jgi:hypothetical protein
MRLPSKWNSHIEDWQHSGLKQVEYCRQHHLNRRTFSARLSDYRKSHQDDRPVLIPIRVQSTLSPAMVIKHAKGVHVELPMTTSASWLAELLRCLD